MLFDFNNIITSTKKDLTNLLVDFGQILPPQFDHTGHLAWQVSTSQEGSFG